MTMLRAPLLAAALLVASGCATNPTPPGTPAASDSAKACTTQCEATAANCAVACNADAGGPATADNAPMLCQSNCSTALENCQKACR